MPPELLSINLMIDSRYVTYTVPSVLAVVHSNPASFEVCCIFALSLNTWSLLTLPLIGRILT